MYTWSVSEFTGPFEGTKPAKIHQGEDNEMLCEIACVTAYLFDDLLKIPFKIVYSLQPERNGRRTDAWTYVFLSRSRTPTTLKSIEIKLKNWNVFMSGSGNKKDKKKTS